MGEGERHYSTFGAPRKRASFRDMRATCVTTRQANRTPPVEIQNAAATTSRSYVAWDFGGACRLAVICRLPLDRT
jgi:hypothetical protein